MTIGAKGPSAYQELVQRIRAPIFNRDKLLQTVVEWLILTPSDEIAPRASVSDRGALTKARVFLMRCVTNKNGLRLEWGEGGPACCQTLGLFQAGEPALTIVKSKLLRLHLQPVDRRTKTLFSAAVKKVCRKCFIAAVREFGKLPGDIARSTRYSGLTANIDEAMRSTVRFIKTNFRSLIAGDEPHYVFNIPIMLYDRNTRRGYYYATKEMDMIYGKTGASVERRTDFLGRMLEKVKMSEAARAALETVIEESVRHKYGQHPPDEFKAALDRILENPGAVVASLRKTAGEIRQLRVSASSADIFEDIRKLQDRNSFLNDLRRLMLVLPQHEDLGVFGKWRHSWTPLYEQGLEYEQPEFPAPGAKPYRYAYYCLWHFEILFFTEWNETIKQYWFPEIIAAPFSMFEGDCFGAFFVTAKKKMHLDRSLSVFYRQAQRASSSINEALRLDFYQRVLRALNRGSDSNVKMGEIIFAELPGIFHFDYAAYYEIVKEGYALKKAWVPAVGTDGFHIIPRDHNGPETCPGECDPRQPHRLPGIDRELKRDRETMGDGLERVVFGWLPESDDCIRCLNKRKGYTAGRIKSGFWIACFPGGEHPRPFLILLGVSDTTVSNNYAALVLAKTINYAVSFSELQATLVESNRKQKHYVYLLHHLPHIALQYMLDASTEAIDSESKPGRNNSRILNRNLTKIGEFLMKLTSRKNDRRLPGVRFCLAEEIRQFIEAAPYFSRFPGILEAIDPGLVDGGTYERKITAWNKVFDFRGFDNRRKVNVSKGGLYSIIENLVFNSFEHGGLDEVLNDNAPPLVFLELAENPDHLLFTYYDRGKGFTPDNLAKVNQWLCGEEIGDDGEGYGISIMAISYEAVTGKKLTYQLVDAREDVRWIKWVFEFPLA